MVVDSMTKYEVMNELRNDFDREIIPYYYNVLEKRIKPLIIYRAQREKKVINLGWEEYSTTRGNTFKLLKRGDIQGTMPEFEADFIWRNKRCYAFFFQKGYVLVFQKHCLERYAERVLNDSKIQLEDILKIIRKQLKFNFNIVLPTPSHPCCIYFVAADALFLGDYEDLEGKYTDKCYNWLNTCISLKEARTTQKGILHSLSILQEYVSSSGINPIESKEVYLKNKNRLIKTNTDKEKLVIFFKYYYMLYQLMLMFKMPFEDIFKTEIDADMDFLKKELEEFSVPVADLSPYGETNGFAIKGEIDYRGKNK